MRLFGYIIAILVILLGFIPCVDTHPAGRQLSVVEQQGEQNHEEYCSPFCHCSCCAITSIQHDLPEMIITVTSFSVHHATPYAAGVLEVSIPVWQPPQLA